MRVLTGHEIGPENLEETLTGPKSVANQRTNRSVYINTAPRRREPFGHADPLSSALLSCPESLLPYCLPVSTSRAVPGRGVNQ